VLCVEARELRPDAVVVSLGLDAAAEDPESPLQVTAAGYREAARRIAALAPAVFIQEGGYHLPTLGALAVAALEGASGAIP
jgi:acetoin utilization deacetylase AcuC-like enzyme